MIVSSKDKNIRALKKPTNLLNTTQMINYYTGVIQFPNDGLHTRPGGQVPGPGTFGEVTVDKRARQRLHSDITQVTVYDGNEQILKRERFPSRSTKIVNVCDCPEGFVKDDFGECTQAPDPVE